MKRIAMRSLGTLLVLLWASSCVPYSDNPLTAPGVQDIDKSICGTWFWRDGDEQGYVHIGLDDESKLLRIVMLELGKGGQLDLSEYSAHTSLLGNNRYLNLKPLRAAGSDNGYIFVKYATSAEFLDISLMDINFVEKAVRDGLIKGALSEKAMYSSAHITDTSRNLQSFFLKYDRDMFKEKKRLHKLNLPEQAESPR